MKPIATEKAIMMIESANVLTFEVDKRKSKESSAGADRCYPPGKKAAEAPCG